MSVLQAIVLGAVQGLTEFIPISSSGHLVLVPAALGWPSPGLTFDVMLHSGSLVALVVYFRGDLSALVRGALVGDGAQRRLVLLLVIGTVPAVAAALVLGDYFESAFEREKASAIQLLITAFVLVAAEQALAHHRRRADRAVALRSMDDLGPSDAAVIGIAQAISILPGISRSGATIGAGLSLRLERPDSARFAFLLAIPALAGASVFSLPDIAGEPPVGAAAALGGLTASLATSYLAIAGLIRYLRTRTLYPFAAYCVVAAIVFYALV